MTRWLLRIYPATWRTRYGEELDQLVSDAGGMSVGTSVDLINGGLRERGRALKKDLTGGGGMTVGPAWRHPTGLAVLAMVVLLPVLTFVVLSMLAFQFGVTPLQQPLETVNAWMSGIRFLDLLLVLSPAVALLLAALPLVRIELTNGDDGPEAHLGIRLRAANVLVSAMSLGIGALLIWHIVVESVMRVGP